MSTRIHFRLANMKSLLVSGILLDLFSMMCCQCSNQKPNVNTVESYIIESSEPVVIGFVGHSVQFWLKVNLSTLSNSGTMKIYNNNCEIKTKSCDDPICTVEYNITNLSISDNDTDISFCLVAPSTICFSSSSHLIVKDIPPPVNISVSVGCKEIEVSYSPIDSDTRLQCEVYHSINSEPAGHDELIYNNTHSNDSNPFVLHSNIIRNHTGIYCIIIQPSNSAGIGDITEEEIHLGTDLLEFNVTGIFPEIHKGYLFYVRIDIQVNETCPLSIPNSFHLSSNCSSDPPETYEQNGHLYHLLGKQKKYCLFNITDSGGNLKKVNTNIRSFNIQEFKYEELLESLVIICGFTPGSTTDKCIIRISSNHSDYNTTTHNIPRANSDSLIACHTIPQIPAGTYILQVIEEHDDVIIVEELVNIPSPSSCIPDSITSAVSILTSKTPSVLHTSPISDKHENYNGYIIAVVASVILSIMVIILLVVVGIITFVLVRKWRTCESYLVTNRWNKQTISGDTPAPNQSRRKLSVAEPVRTITSEQEMVLSSIDKPEGSCSGQTQNETSTKVYNRPNSDDKRLREVVNPDDKTVKVLAMDSDTTYSHQGHEEIKIVGQKVEYVNQGGGGVSCNNTSSIQSESTQLLNKEKP